MANRIAIAFIALGTALRFVWALVLHPPLDYLFSDMAGYVARATLIADGHDLTRYDVFQATGAQMVLALPLSIFGTGRTGLWAAAVLWALLSSATLFFSWRLAYRWLGPVEAGVVAALMALWPLQVFGSGYFLSDTPALALLTAGLWLIASPRAGIRAVAGVCLAGAAACRPELLVNVGIATVFAAAVMKRRALAPAAAGFAVLVLAVGLSNSAIAGTPTLFSENSGFVFFEGHCDARFVTGGVKSRPFAIGSPVRLQEGSGTEYAFPGTPVYSQGFFFERGLECVRNDGLAHVGLMAGELVAMTATTVPWPEADDSAEGVRVVARWANLGYSLALPVIVIGAIMLIRHRRRALLEPLAHLAAPFLVAAVFIGEPRYRIPYDFFGFVLLAALLIRRPSGSASS